MKNILLLWLLFFATLDSMAQSIVSVEKERGDFKLIVDGQDFIINGMNWDYFPIGTNFDYSIWTQPDEIIKAALDNEMSMLKNIGVNAVRQYTGVPPKWIQYIYDNYGIYTMINHAFGRYGLTLNGEWVSATDYTDPITRDKLIYETKEMVEIYKDTPGLLLYLLGNENNYGLFWEGGETEDFPNDKKLKKQIGEKQGRPLYKLMNDATLEMKTLDSSHPIAICNGDVVYIKLIAQECKDIDIYGVNMYRGKSFGNAFKHVKRVLDMPIMFTEFGADAYNAVTNQEDQKTQAIFAVENWKEIYQNAAGLGKSGNSIGGFTFQFSDGWWKFGQTKNLDIHDNNASWVNGGYSSDFVNGQNNMNEEWFGICAKGESDEQGLYTLYPRAAYFALQEVHSFSPMDEEISHKDVETYFSKIQVLESVLKAKENKTAMSVE